ncbi:TetR family transcriptional regulator [Burkholderia stagnalis]|uniref:TetR/AcrR family transcriptional regulator n=1 Tax=Burkholderia stagnalis TaxID=1503054 RepID=A0A6L3N1T7_9BURK|nr:TetR/AcrR family transcriptional regulator [Burkholderia stagnalis]KAB0639684.1 TetR/AcrR family transcriptional regulator [Burkholderia stagnalis]KVC61355.1 TetR family transcriptional regulator [Burkholderia stagnalis]KVN06109.1 TetR family transcriptional regulator [Burkholderia stagnalis]KVN20278.1 TetR family transcriptional regulator [Burkholderia stagnalis]KVN32366.1 TetR family transcriptional regulator [Burkholderia stagnalis]
MTSATSSATGRHRRPQSERRATTRHALINATLRCMKEVGLAKTSITEICSQAGFSRGALLHHFPHKNDLLVASYIEWLEGKLASLQQRIHSTATVREEVVAWRTQMQETLPMTQEFYWALRNDDDLRARFNAALLTHSIGADVSAYLPNTSIDNTATPMLTRYVIACFIRGLCFQELFVRDQSIPDQAFDHFVEILSAFVERLPAAHE